MQGYTDKLLDDVERLTADSVGVADRLEEVRRTLARLRDQLPDLKWVMVAERHPAAHHKYLVRRGGFLHTATPCYGLHPAWWVPMGISGQEYEPVSMLDTDEWQPLPP